MFDWCVSDTSDGEVAGLSEGERFQFVTKVVNLSNRSHGLSSTSFKSSVRLITGWLIMKFHPRSSALATTVSVMKQVSNGAMDLSKALLHGMEAVSLAARLEHMVLCSNSLTVGLFSSLCRRTLDDSVASNELQDLLGSVVLASVGAAARIMRGCPAGTCSSPMEGAWSVTQLPAAALAPAVVSSLDLARHWFDKALEASAQLPRLYRLHLADVILQLVVERIAQVNVDGPSEASDTAEVTVDGNELNISLLQFALSALDSQPTQGMQINDRPQHLPARAMESISPKLRDEPGGEQTLRQHLQLSLAFLFMQAGQYDQALACIDVLEAGLSSSAQKMEGPSHAGARAEPTNAELSSPTILYAKFRILMQSGQERLSKSILCQLLVVESASFELCLEAVAFAVKNQGVMDTTSGDQCGETRIQSLYQQLLVRFPRDPQFAQTRLWLVRDLLALQHSSSLRNNSSGKSSSNPALSIALTIAEEHFSRKRRVSRSHRSVFRDILWKQVLWIQKSCTSTTLPNSGVGSAVEWTHWTECLQQILDVNPLSLATLLPALPETAHPSIPDQPLFLGERYADHQGTEKEGVSADVISSLLLRCDSLLFLAFSPHSPGSGQLLNEASICARLAWEASRSPLTAIYDFRASLALQVTDTTACSGLEYTVGSKSGVWRAVSRLVQCSWYLSSRDSNSKRDHTAHLGRILEALGTTVYPGSEIPIGSCTDKESARTSDGDKSQRMEQIRIEAKHWLLSAWLEHSCRHAQHCAKTAGGQVVNGNGQVGYEGMPSIVAVMCELVANLLRAKQSGNRNSVRGQQGNKRPRDGEPRHAMMLDEQNLHLVTTEACEAGAGDGAGAKAEAGAEAGTEAGAGPETARSQSPIAPSRKRATLSQSSEPTQKQSQDQTSLESDKTKQLNQPNESPSSTQLKSSCNDHRLSQSSPLEPATHISPNTQATASPVHTQQQKAQPKCSLVEQLLPPLRLLLAVLPAIGDRKDLLQRLGMTEIKALVQLLWAAATELNMAEESQNIAGAGVGAGVSAAAEVFEALGSLLGFSLDLDLDLVPSLSLELKREQRGAQVRAYLCAASSHLDCVSGPGVVKRLSILRRSFDCAERARIACCSLQAAAEGDSDMRRSGGEDGSMDGDWKRLSSLALVVQLSALCSFHSAIADDEIRVNAPADTTTVPASLPSALQFVKSQTSSFALLQPNQLRWCLLLVRSEAAHSVECLYALLKIGQTVLQDSDLSQRLSILLQLLELAPSRSSALHHVEEFTFSLRADFEGEGDGNGNGDGNAGGTGVKESLSPMLRDQVDVATRLCYNLAAQLLECDQPAAAESFATHAKHLLTFSSLEFSHEHRAKVEDLHEVVGRRCQQPENY